MRLSGNHKPLQTIGHLYINVANGEVSIMETNIKMKLLKTSFILFSKPFELDKQIVENLINIVIKNKLKLYDD